MTGKSIDDYLRKRDFGKTPEPEPGDVDPNAAGLTYVVHRHDASRLHYDLRLEMEGVLRSWAIPKGFSYDSTDKHLAIRTEDHPMEYDSFQGVIPKGQYGAGTMTIWDRGTYEVLLADDGPSAVAAGEVKLILRGRRLRGEWHLVKTTQGPDTWLLFKSRDRFSGPARDSALGLDLVAAPAAPFAQAWLPMQATQAGFPALDDPDWLYELAFDGRRTLVTVDQTLVAWQGLDVSLPHIEQELTSLRAERAVLDGVLVVMDDNGRPSRARLDAALADTVALGQAVQFYAFDLLYFEAYDLRALPTVDRKAGLRLVLPDLPHVLYVDHVAGDGRGLADAMKVAGLPRMLAKRMDAPYDVSCSGDWAWHEIGASQDTGTVTDALAQARGTRTPGKVKLSNLDKVYWPGAGYTKGDLIAYYDTVADVLLPYLRDRPLHLRRFPNGILGKSFYQKNMQEFLPDWVSTEVVSSDDDGDVSYVVCDDRDTLLFLVNLGSIDLHPWMSHRGSLESPDYAVIDLDPREAPFGHVIQIARRVREVLTEIGLTPYLKTSGATGLHIYVALRAGYSYDQSRMFCEGVARLVARDLPDIATVERVVGQREGRVYVDFGQNRRAQTIVPPYVCRPVRGATVSAPLAWDELTDDLRPARYTIRTMPSRLAALGDLFGSVLTDGEDLVAAASALQELLT